MAGVASIELEQEVSVPIPLELSDSGYAEPALPLSQTLSADYGRMMTNGVEKVALPPRKRGPVMTTTSSRTTGAIPISRNGNGVKHIPKSNVDTENAARKTTIAHQLKESASSKRALIVKVSHIGGHKYAGNAIVSFLPFFSFLIHPSMPFSQIYQPSGSGIWYGRVTPHDVDSIVANTIIEGLVLPPLLRGGLNLTRPNCKTLNDW